MVYYKFCVYYVHSASPALLRSRRTVFSPKQPQWQHQQPPKHVVDSEEKAATNKTLKSLRPRLHLSRHTIIPFDPFQFRCSDQRSAQCHNKTATFAGHVLAEFQRSLSDPKTGVNVDGNFYNVDYAQDVLRPVNGTHPVCLVMAAKVRVLRRKDRPFSEHSVGKAFPKRKLFGRKGDGKAADNTCVIVASAGSLLGSGLGRFIGK